VVVDRRARDAGPSCDALNPAQRLDPAWHGPPTLVAVAERAEESVAPRVDLAFLAKRQAVQVTSGDAHDAPVLHRRHQRGRANEAGLVGVGIGVHGVTQDMAHLSVILGAASEQASFRVYKEADTVSCRERSLPPQRVAKSAFQEVRHPRQGPLGQGGADAQAACRGAPPQLRLHQPHWPQQGHRPRWRSGRVVPERPAGGGEAGQIVRVEMREDDRQELAWQELQPLKQMRLRLDRGDRGRRRQEEIAQPVGDDEALGGLLVVEAPRGEMTVRGDGAQSRKRQGGHDYLSSPAGIASPHVGWYFLSVVVWAAVPAAVCDAGGG